MATAQGSKGGFNTKIEKTTRWINQTLPGLYASDRSYLFEKSIKCRKLVSF
jgi:hypothetical protein